MNIPTPKFAVGEEVFAEYETIAHTNTEIVGATFYKTFTIHDPDTGATDEVFKNVWVYQTTESVLLNTDRLDGFTHWVREEILHKLPPEERISWEDCVFNPNKIEEEV